MARKESSETNLSWQGSTTLRPVAVALFSFATVRIEPRRVQPQYLSIRGQVNSLGRQRDLAVLVHEEYLHSELQKQQEDAASEEVVQYDEP
jgi:hypothetical protein